MEKRPKRVYWSAFSSLYDICTEAEVEFLEVVAKEKALGNYGEAMEMFETSYRVQNGSFQNITSSPALCLELASLFERSSNEHQRLELLDAAIRKGSWNLDSSRAQKLNELLKIEFAESRLLVSGAMREALHCAREMRPYLEAIDVQDYDDIYVGFTSQKHTFYRLLILLWYRSRACSVIIASSAEQIICLAGLRLMTAWFRLHWRLKEM